MIYQFDRMKIGDYVELTVMHPGCGGECTQLPSPETKKGYVSSLSKSKIRLNEPDRDNGTTHFICELSLEKIIKVAHFQKIAEATSPEFKKINV